MIPELFAVIPGCRKEQNGEGFVNSTVGEINGLRLRNRFGGEVLNRSFFNRFT